MLKPLKEIIENYQIPVLQRLVDNEHINSMVEDQKNEYNKYNAFSMLQSFTIAYIIEEQKGYILDGQHRVAVYSQLKKQGYDGSLFYKSQSGHEAELFHHINVRIFKNYPLKGRRVLKKDG